MEGTVLQYYVPVTFLFLYALVHPFPCCLETAWQKLGGAVTPLPQICEWAENEETWVQEAIRATAAKKHIHSRLPLIEQPRPADR